MTEFCMILTTTPDFKTASNLANIILDHKLAACVQISESVKSIYDWKGRRERSDERQVWIKTTQARASELTALIKKHHAYEVPEILWLPVTGGGESYMDWLRESTKAL